MSHQMLGNAMIQLLGIKELGQLAVVGLNRESLVPSASLTMLQIAGRRGALAQSLVSQRDGLSVVEQRQVAKHIFRRIGRVLGPINHSATVVDQPSQFDTHNPAPIGQLAIVAQQPRQARVLGQVRAAAANSRACVRAPRAGCRAHASDRRSGWHLVRPRLLRGHMRSHDHA